MSLDIYLEEMRTVNVFYRNITHNLSKMAVMAGIYEYLWRPDEVKITKAGQLIKPLQLGLDKLLADPDFYKQFNPENGWGSYEGLVKAVEDYISACKAYPDAAVSVSR